MGFEKLISVFGLLVCSFALSAAICLCEKFGRMGNEDAKTGIADSNNTQLDHLFAKFGIRDRHFMAEAAILFRNERS